MNNDIEQFLTEHYPYSSNTKQIYRRVLMLLFDTNPDIERLTSVEFDRWISSIEQWGGSMRWLAYSATRSFLRWKYGDDHPALKLKIKREKSGPQRTLTISQAKKLHDYFDTSSSKGIRDLAIFSILLDTGIRESELCNWQLETLFLDTGTLTVRTKGGEWGYGIFCNHTAMYMTAWLEHRSAIAQSGVQNIFVGIGGTKPGTPITPSGLRVIVRKWGQASGIGPLSPHDFRRTFATIATIAKAPTRLTQLAGRWSHIAYVEHYTRALELQAFLPFSPIAKILDS